MLSLIASMVAHLGEQKAEAWARGVKENLARDPKGGDTDQLRAAAAGYPACDVLHVDGGWTAVVRVPSTRGEERLVLDLLEHERILVHPGFFFDFPGETYVVVSLLPCRDVFFDAVARVLRFAEAGIS